MDLNKHIATNDNASHFHSSGYAKVAYGDRVGSTTTESFGMRRQIDASRQLIKGYHRSAIGNSYSAVRAKPVSTDINRPLGVNGRPSIQQYNAGGSMRVASPKLQSYNPYA
ncbi:MAG: hypothetical protein WA087_00840 [Candidatus Saccharimonadales bacterium]